MATPHPPRQEQQYPRVGVAVLIFDGEGRSVVLGERKGSHGAGTLAFPGGHLELHESFSTCAAREVLEETGLALQSVRYLSTTNDFIPEPLHNNREASGESSKKELGTRGKHYITIFMGAVRRDGGVEPKVLEPEKCVRWDWVPWSDVTAWSSPHPSSSQHSNNNTEENNDSGGGAGSKGPKLFQPILNLFAQRGSKNGGDGTVEFDAWGLYQRQVDDEEEEADMTTTTTTMTATLEEGGT